MSDTPKQHGGKRPGSGRKKGGQVTKTSEIALKAAAEGIQPIEVILTTMRKAWESGNVAQAAEMAEIALPYTTARLSSVAVKHEDALGKLSDEDLAMLLAYAREAAAVRH